MEIYERIALQKPHFNNGYKSLAERFVEVNKNSALDNWIIARTEMRNRFILYPQIYENFISSAVEDIENNLENLLKDW